MAKSIVLGKAVTFFNLKKVLVALSGGVDSATCAVLMKKEGYELIGATMRLHTKESSSCLTEKDIEDAESICKNLKIPYSVVDFSSDFNKYVIENFIEAYENGATPNPCIECNFRLKFDKLFEYAMENGCDYIATGHYARIEYSEKYGRLVLKKAINEKKDQSYVLWRLDKNKLEHTLFPLGSMPSKDEVRALAMETGLDVGSKKDSQDICFIPDGDYGKFIENYRKKSYPVGNFVNLQGETLGKHNGIIRYTIGQRKGLGLALPAPMYVVAKNLSTNEVVLGFSDDLLSRELWADEVNLTALDTIDEPICVQAKIRYNQEAKPATATLENGRLHIIFDEPQRAICRGQSVVIYDHDIVLGGGIIA